MTMTRASYDIVAASYAEFLPDAHDGRPLDAAIMRAFAELTEGPVGDLGCGTGRITQHLHELGKDAFGVDLSDGMVDQARKLYPHLSFRQGDITKLDLEDGSLGGAVVWYSTVHMPAAEVPWQEFHRVLKPGGHLLHAFKLGNQKRHLTYAYGHDVDLNVYWHDIDETVRNATEAGFNEVARLQRQKGVDEGGPQAFLLLCKRNPAAGQTS
jgi:SAM-dependent methyltransferase